MFWRDLFVCSLHVIRTNGRKRGSSQSVSILCYIASKNCYHILFHIDEEDLLSPLQWRRCSTRAICNSRFRRNPISLRDGVVVQIRVLFHLRLFTIICTLRKSKCFHFLFVQNKSKSHNSCSFADFELVFLLRAFWTDIRDIFAELIVFLGH